MPVFQIVFFIINLSVPLWLWNRTSTHHAESSWAVWQKGVTRVIDSDGGFPGCSTLGLVDTLQDLCELSKARLTDNHSEIYERASRDVVFSCEYKKDEIEVGWHLEKSETGDLDCRDPGADAVSMAPTFVFTHQGRLKALQFTAQDGSRQEVSARNCRVKVNVAKQIDPIPKTVDELLSRIGHTKGDPEDYLNANFICFVFDLSPLWNPWRDRFPR